MKNKCIYNAKIVQPDKIVEGLLKISNGRIEAVGYDKLPRPEAKSCEMIDACGMYVMPGMIDITNNTIEKEIEPSPEIVFPFDIAFYESEKKLSSAGITTVYQTLSLTKDHKKEEQLRKLEIIKNIREKKLRRSMLNHRIHLLYEISQDEIYNNVIELIDSKAIDYLTLIDNSDGIDKSIDVDDLSSTGKKNKPMNDNELNWMLLQHVIKHSCKKGIKIAASKNYSMERLNDLVKFGVGIIEFPENKLIIDSALNNNLFICTSAPEIVIGKSCLSNMGIKEASESSERILISSGSYFSSLLSSVFKIGTKINNLPLAVKMGTLNPARAVGIDKYQGSLEIGKSADLIFVEMYYGYPIVRETYLKGRRVFLNSYFE